MSSTSLSDSSVKVAFAQINPTVGDLSGNVQKIVDFSRRAHASGARLVLTPELSLCGYPPEDLLLRPAFMMACAEALLDCAKALADLQNLVVVVGHPHQFHGVVDVRSKSHAVQQRFNAASVLEGGRIKATYCKRELPNYQVFDERRYFASGRDVEAAPGQGAVVFDVGGLKFGLNICEDAWFSEPARAAKAAGAQVLCVLNASPFHLGKIEEREQRMRACVQDVGLPLLYVHMTGGQDEVVFDGGSFSMDVAGHVMARAAMFEEALSFVDVSVSDSKLSGGEVVAVPSMESQAWSALVTGVRDYMGKNGFKNALIGLSGGIDSALVLAIAVDALGADRVRTVMMPSPYTADISMIDARDMAKRLKVRYDEISIEPMFDAFKQSLAGEFQGLKEDTTEENIQARVRGTMLMALSNKFGSIVLTTGNKSEMATGYCTLYGDMAGGFAVIKDVAKTLVYRLATWKNTQPNGGLGEIIPLRIITRPPSAELRADQTDQDSLPEYEVLDAILQRYMEDDQSMEDIIAAGFQRADVERVTWLIKTNEYKRRQAPIGIRITHRGFGRDWRYPITSKFRA
jgi:NAD+ synthase (glutamine-hydrolysing)